MRILILAPESDAVRTIQRELIGLGHRVQIVLPPKEEGGALIQESVDTFGPHVVHAFIDPPELNLPDGVPFVTGLQGKTAGELVEAWSALL